MSLIIERFIANGFGWKVLSPNSQKNYRTHILRFEAFLKTRSKSAHDGTVTDQDVADHVDQLKAKYHHNTVAVNIAAIKSYFKWLNKEGALTFKPTIKSLKHVEPEHKELTTSELDFIIKSMTESSPDHPDVCHDLYKRRDLAMFSLMMYCGFKTEEVTAINVEDLDFENAEIMVKSQKGSRKNSLTISPKQKRSFRAALDEMKVYLTAKSKNGIFWKKFAINEENSQHKTISEKEPFFLNKHCTRLSARSLRRRLLQNLENPKSHNIRDFRHTYLKNLDRVMECAAVEA